MGARDLFEELFRAFSAYRLRALLTLLGVIIGVSTVVLLTSLIGGGERALMRSNQSATGADIVTAHTRWGRHWRRPSKGMDLSDVRALGSSPEVASHAGGDAEVVPELDKESYHWTGKTWERFWLRGASTGFPGFYHLQVTRGRFLTDSDRQARDRVAVVGPHAAELLGVHPGAAGDLGWVEGAGERWRVVGLLASRPSFGDDWKTWDDSVLVPDTTWLATVKGGNAVDVVNVRAPDADAQQLDGLAWVMRTVIRGRHRGVENFQVEDPRDKGQQMAGMALALTVLVALVALVCLGVGGINLMNIMLVSVAERTREIGLRRALGATRGQIMAQFLVEAVVLSGLGGLAGVAWGVLLGVAISALLGRLLGFWPYVLDPGWTLASLAAALAVGAVFGLFPARAASRLDPIEALRN